MKVNSVDNPIYCWEDCKVHIIILNGLLDNTSATTTSILSGLGRILLGIFMSMARTTPPPRDD